MSLITTLTRNYLTRSFKPFIFTNAYDAVLDYENLQNLGLYIHIPFCKSICSFCPYCKELYTPEKCNTYIDYLIKEIQMVARGAQKSGAGQGAQAANSAQAAQKGEGARKEVTSLYFGGGTPALAHNRLGEIIAAVKEHFDITEGIGVELHPDNVTPEILASLKKAGVTKISIGIQSFQEKYQTVLGRKAVDAARLKDVLGKVQFETVSFDFIFALPGQNYYELKSDIDMAFECGANHIAIYPFIDFSFATSGIPVMKKNEKRRLLDDITNYCLDRGFVRSSIWTFSKGEDIRYSSMTRDNFLGFGCSATTLLKDSFKINTFSVEEYIKRIQAGSLPTALTIRFTLRQRMMYYLFWTAYSTQVDSAQFEQFFGVPLKKKYGIEARLAKLFGFVTEAGGIYKMTLKGAFFYHYYENYYTLSYIDKMWNCMRKTAFPKGLKL